MKKLLILPILTSWFILFAGRAQQRVISDPDVESNTSENTAIEKIICSDTATFLHVDAYNTPGYWVKFAASTVLTGSGGKVYKLVSAENFELDKEVYMPESGHYSFILRFEPLDRDETLLNLSEGDFDGAYEIKGISLKKKEKSRKKFSCKLEGSVVDRPYSSRLKLVKITESIRSSSVYIPIRNNTFSYELNYDEEEAYELIFFDEWNDASWWPIRFYPQNGTVYFTLYPKERRDEYEIKGGKRNTEFLTYLDAEKRLMSALDSIGKERHELDNAGNFFSEKARSLREEIRMASEANDRKKQDSLWRFYDKLDEAGEMYTLDGQICNQKEKKVFEKWDEWKLQYAKDHPTIIGYSIFIKLLDEKLYKERSKKDFFDIVPFEKIYREVYQPLYPDHVYTAHVKDLLDYRDIPDKGTDYIDFTLPDLFRGELHTLSDRIRGKVALVDFWSTWCGPCMRATVEMKPVYEKYKSKGFTVVAVVQEEKNAELLRKTVAKHNFPWLTLIDLDSKEKVWKKYGIDNSGGGLFLIDATGKILFVNPKPETVDKMLADIFR